MLYKNNEPKKGSKETAKIQIADLNPFNGVPVSGSNFDGQVPASHKEPVPGLFPVGLTLIMGPSKAGLTTICSHCMAKITNGQPVFDRYQTEAQRAGYQTLIQDSIRAKEILKTLAIELDAYLSNIVMIPGEKEIGFGHTTRVQKYLERQKLKVIFLDPIIGGMGMKIAGRFHPSYEYLNRLSKIAHQTGTAIIAVYHSTQKELDENVFASKSLAAAADNIILLTNRYENEDATYYTIQHYGRMIPKHNIYLKSEGSRYNLTAIEELPKWEIDPEIKTKLILLSNYGLTQVEMGQVLGISQGQISKMLQEIGPIDQGTDTVYVDDISYFEPEESEEFEEEDENSESEELDSGNTESPEKGEQDEPKE